MPIVDAPMTLISGEPSCVAVIGAGAIGCRFAIAAFRSGYRTILEDFRADILERAELEVRGTLDVPKSLQHHTHLGIASAPRVQAFHADLATARTVEDGVREADLVFDTTVDDAELKLEIFTLLDKFARPGAVCATIANSISIAELAAITYRPQLCVGVRFDEPRAEIEQLTIIRAPKTSDESVRACVQFAQRAHWRTVIELESAPATSPPAP